ncbi:MAG: lysophospholipid acyltransferase family protein [Clostridiaceae bacterium]|nr:lysophospholipid acyltransferase family protein [Clostridiaceae bacterium]
MNINVVPYGFYMMYMRMRGGKRAVVNKFKGKREAWEYGQSVFSKWSDYTIKAVGMDIHVEGLENIPKETCIFMGNHQSILDIPVLRHVINREVDLVAKQELLKIPVIGYWIKNLNCVAIDRSNAREGIKAINKVVDYVKEGYTYAVFPEGTRSKDGKVHEFKKGTFKIATKSKAPIVPFAIKGTSACFEDNRAFKKGKVYITFGKAVRTNDLTREEEKSLPQDVQKQVIEMFYQLGK